MFGILGFQHPHIQIVGESQFSNESFLFELLLKCDGLQKIIFRAPVWDSGFHCNASFLLGASVGQWANLVAIHPLCGNVGIFRCENPMKE